jgi:hypothetical protein
MALVSRQKLSIKSNGSILAQRLVNSRSKTFVQQQLPNYAAVVVVPADVPTISTNADVDTELAIKQLV